MQLPDISLPSHDQPTQEGLKKNTKIKAGNNHIKRYYAVLLQNREKL
jgi:hypothetical protein